MSVRALVALGVAALLVALGVTLAQSAPRQAGTNSVTEVARAAELKRGGRVCQAGEIIPEDAGRLRLLVGTFGKPVPELRVTVTGPDGPLTSGRLAAGAKEGHVEIPLRRVAQTTPGSEVCIRVGPQRTVLYGQPPRLRLDWLREGSESWLAMIPTVAHRFALGKASLFGSLWLLAIGLVVLVALAAAIRVLLRELDAAE